MKKQLLAVLLLATPILSHAAPADTLRSLKTAATHVFKNLRAQAAERLLTPCETEDGSVKDNLYCDACEGTLREWALYGKQVECPGSFDNFTEKETNEENNSTEE